MTMASGYQITFFTHQAHRHGRGSLHHWLLEQARALGIGATMTAGGEGLGGDGKLHSAHFFELVDEPVQVTVVASAEQCEKLLAVVSAEVDELFFVKTPVEFGRLGRRVPAP